MPDQIIDAVMARAIQADVARTHPLAGWIVMRDQPDYPDEMIARLVTEAPTPYILLGRTLPEIHAQLPLGLQHSERQPSIRLRWLRFGFWNSGRWMRIAPMDWPPP
jgi:hypothetical protein